VERSSGLDVSEQRGARRFPGYAHAFMDRTDRPCQTIDTKTWRIILEQRDDMTAPAPDDTKPPYGVPTMDEIRALPWNGFNAVSTFSGCGGSSTGYRMAGFRVLWASEFIDAARESYEANKAPYTILDGRDIREVEASDILNATGMGVGELDLFDGSPPCSSFSTAGKREKLWGETKKYSDKAQRTDDLFFEFARLLGGVKPKTFVAENVSGLVKGSAKGYFLEILARLKAEGYVVSARLLDAQWLGVPQTRQRLIFVGVRQDLAERYGVAPAHPSPLPYRYSVREALPWIASTFEKAPPVEPEADMTPYAVGAEWDKLKQGEQSDRYFQLVRSSLDAPVNTITAAGGNPSTASVSHPLEKRKFSIAELRRLCGFPDDFILAGSFGQQWERLGRSVPPVMMQHIAASVRDRILVPLRAAGA
jgi:DNA (cytosine-5)-methyltransferase 1